MIEKMKFETIDNVRELGGIKTQDGRAVKKGLLFRGGKITGLSDNDKKFFTDNNLTLIVDFRTVVEKDKHPDDEINNAKNINLAILDNEILQKLRSDEAKKDFFGWIIGENAKDPNFATNYMIETYKNLVLNDYNNEMYAKFIDLLLENEGSTFWHCTSGKDRTGFGAIVLLSALGVSKETIYEDYMYSNKCIFEDEDAIRNTLKMSSLDEQYFEEFRDFLLVKDEYFNTVYREIENKFGTMNAFLEKGLKITPEKKELLRKKYLE